MIKATNICTDDTNSFMIKYNLNNKVGPSDCQNFKRLIISTVSWDYKQIQYLTDRHEFSIVQWKFLQ